MSKQLSWNQRFMLIDHYKPTDSETCSVFGVTQAELDTARHLRSTGGAFAPITNMDVTSYSHLFSGSSTSTSIKKTSTSTDTSNKPITATKRSKIPKKRGRKGDRIKNAFMSVPTDAIPVDTFASTHNVSLAVLRQSKRFDTNPELGTVHVKKVVKDSGNKVLCIWRERPDTTGKK